MFVDLSQIVGNILLVLCHFAIVRRDVGNAHFSGFPSNLTVMFGIGFIGFLSPPPIVGRHGLQRSLRRNRQQIEPSDVVDGDVIVAMEVLGPGRYQEAKILAVGLLVAGLRANIVFQHFLFDHIGINDGASVKIKGLLRQWLFRSQCVAQGLSHIADTLKVRRNDFHDRAFGQLIELGGIIAPRQEVINHFGVFPGRTLGDHVAQPGDPAWSLTQFIGDRSSQRTVQIGAQPFGAQLDEVSGSLILIEDPGQRPIGHAADTHLQRPGENIMPGKLFGHAKVRTHAQEVADRTQSFLGGLESLDGCSLDAFDQILPEITDDVLGSHLLR